MSKTPIRDGFDELASGALSRTSAAALEAYRHYFFAGAAHLLYILTEDGYSRRDYEAFIDRIEAELDAYRDDLAVKLFLSRRAANTQ